MGSGVEETGMRGSYLIHPTCQMPGERASELFLNAFGFKMDGFFVECGAYDGRAFSFTWGLSRMGWRGIYAEPEPNHARACRRHHRNNPGVRVYEVAVGRENCQCDLYLGGEVSSVKSPFENAASRAWGLDAEKKMPVIMEMLDTLLRHAECPLEFDLLVIDVEGSEEDVLRGFSFWTWRPKMVIIELHEKGTEAIYLDEDGCNRAARFAHGYFRDKYDKVHVDPVNTVFVRKT